MQALSKLVLRNFHFHEVIQFIIDPRSESAPRNFKTLNFKNSRRILLTFFDLINKTSSSSLCATAYVLVYWLSCDQCSLPVLIYNYFLKLIDDSCIWINGRVLLTYKNYPHFYWYIFGEYTHSKQKLTITSLQLYRAYFSIELEPIHTIRPTVGLLTLLARFFYCFMLLD